MAGIRGLATTTSEVALSAATAKTVLQITAPANQRVLIKKWGAYSDGVNPLAAAIEVLLVKQTSAGTMTSLTIAKITPGSETIQTSASHTATAEPTPSPAAGNILDVAEYHPQSGYESILPMGEEIILAGGERAGIVITSPAAVNVRPKIWFEE
jgi:hypothetical protein